MSVCPFRPKNGSIVLYNRKKVKYRKDGYCWKKRKDGKTTREDHMKLKVQGMEVSNPVNNQSTGGELVASAVNVSVLGLACDVTGRRLVFGLKLLAGVSPPVC